MFIVKDDNPPVKYQITPGPVTDAEGNEIADAQLSFAVVSDNPDVVAVAADQADARRGQITFGAPGNASVTVTVTLAQGQTLGVFGAQFHVTTGDPAAMAGGTIAFEGLTEASPE